MCKIFKNIIIVSIFFSFIYAPLDASAQYYKGQYSNKSNEKKEDKAARPVPRVFSSQISSVDEAEKLDLIHNDLYTSLWLYAATDFVYQKKMYSQVEPNKFRLTRYAKEFTIDLDKAMDNLNNNYAKITSEIKDAEEKYIEIKSNIAQSEHEILDQLWQGKISKLNETKDHYFKMQSKFLNTYRNLVGFVLKQGGSYAYDSNKGGLVFYNGGAYKYFGQTIDKLKKITYEQKTILKSYIPANLDTEIE